MIVRGLSNWCQIKPQGQGSVEIASPALLPPAAVTANRITGALRD
jgi:hypothetical protein